MRLFSIYFFLISPLLFIPLITYAENPEPTFSPKQNETSVSTKLKRVRVKFSQNISKDSLWINGDCDTRFCAKAATFPDSKSLVLLFPKGLKKNKTYTIWINSKGGNQFPPIKWVFSTNAKIVDDVKAEFSLKNEQLNVDPSLKEISVSFDTAMNTQLTPLFTNCPKNECMKNAHWLNPKLLKISFPNGLQKNYTYNLRFGFPPFDFLRTATGEYVKQEFLTFSTSPASQTKPTIKSFFPIQGGALSLKEKRHPTVTFDQDMNVSAIVITGVCGKTPCYKLAKWIDSRTLSIMTSYKGDYDINIGSPEMGGIWSANGGELEAQNWKFKQE